MAFPDSQPSEPSILSPRIRNRLWNAFDAWINVLRKRSAELPRKQLAAILTEHFGGVRTDFVQEIEMNILARFFQERSWDELRRLLEFAMKRRVSEGFLSAECNKVFADENTDYRVVELMIVSPLGSAETRSGSPRPATEPLSVHDVRGALRPFQFVLDHIVRVVAGWDSIRPFANEGAYRDDCKRLLNSHSIIAAPEETSLVGSTDLWIVVPASPHERLPTGMTHRSLRVEFKVWGRGDYKRLPEKPIKYMSERELVGCVVMVPEPNSRSGAIGAAFVQNVRGQAGYPTVALHQKLYGDELPFHFVGQHVDQRYDSCKLILYVLATHRGTSAKR